MFTRIIVNTPPWVWPLLLALLWLGFSQTRARSVGLVRILILPAAMTALSLSGTLASFGSSAAIWSAWSIAALITLAVLIRRPLLPLTRYDASTGLFHLPGSWLPLALILAIFAVKYATGATLAIRPEMATNAGFSLAVSALYGAFSGIFIAGASRIGKLACEKPASQSNCSGRPETMNRKADMEPLSESPALFTLTGIQRQFALGETTVQALRGIDLEIRRGESVAIWGPSGSGKSTLLNLLGLIDTPSAGQIGFDGEDVLKLDDDALTDCRNRKIGFVFQSFNLVPVLTALENVMLPLQIAGVCKREARQRAERWLKQVGLERFTTFRPDRLSGGQRQRVAIARALVVEPMLVIADEPTANLDSENSRAIVNLLQTMNRETSVTCIFSTHDPRLLEHVPRHIRLADGLIEEDRHLEIAA